MYKYTKKPMFVHSQLEFIPTFHHSKEKDTQQPDYNRCGYAKPMQKRTSSFIKTEEPKQETKNESRQDSTNSKEIDEIKISKNTTSQHNYAKPHMKRNGYPVTQKEMSLTPPHTKTKFNDGVLPKSPLVEESNVKNTADTLSTKKNSNLKLIQEDKVSQPSSSQNQTVQQISQKLTEDIIMSEDLITDEAQLQQTENQMGQTASSDTSDCDFNKLKEALQAAIINIDYAKIAVSFFLLLVNLLLLNPYLFLLLILALIVYVIYLICKYCACQNELKTNKLC